MVSALVRSLLSWGSAPPPVIIRESQAQNLVISSTPSGQPVTQPKTFGDYLDLYSALAVVYRCATLNATTLASGDKLIYRNVGDDREELDGHPVLDLLARPNPEMSGRELWLSTWLGLELTGNAYWELARKSKRGQVAEVWPLNPARVQVIPSATGIAGYRYEVNGQRKDLPVEDVFHIRYYDPANDWYGISPYRSVTRTLVADELLEKSVNAMLRNGTRLSGILMTEPGLDSSQLEALAIQWRSLYAGVENWGKSLIAAGGRDYKALGLTPAEFQAIESKRWNKAQIMQVSGVYPVIYGLEPGDTSATRENATTQRKLYHELTIAPKAALVDDQISYRFLAKVGFDDPDLQFATDFSSLPVVRESAIEEARANAALTANGVVTINEVREQMGYSPADWGDAWWGPMATMQIAAPEGEENAQQIAPTPEATDVQAASSRNVSVTQDTALNGAQVSSASAIVQAVADGRLPRDSGIGQLVVFFNLSPAEAEAIMGSVGRGFEPAAPTSAPSSKLPPIPSPPPLEGAPPTKEFAAPVTKVGAWDSVIDAGAPSADEPLFKRMLELFRAITADHGQRALAAIGIDTRFDATTPTITRWLQGKTIKFAKETWNTSAEQLRATLREGVDAGENMQSLIKRVDEVFQGRKNNAEAVARTETSGTANYGAIEAYREAGLEKKRWVTSRDAAVRDSHQTLEGDVVGLDEPFSNGLYFPGDTNHGGPADFVNCRCDITAVIPGRREQPEWLTAQWREFAAGLDRDEKRVAKLWRQIVDEQRRRVVEAMERRGG